VTDHGLIGVSEQGRPVLGRDARGAKSARKRVSMIPQSELCLKSLTDQFADLSTFGDEAMQDLQSRDHATFGRPPTSTLSTGGEALSDSRKKSISSLTRVGSRSRLGNTAEIGRSWASFHAGSTLTKLLCAMSLSTA
jgi:hypothetical protein